MWKRIFVLLLLIPLADAILLVLIGNAIGWAITVAIVVLTALLGMLFVRAEGRHTLRKLQSKVIAGALPTDELIDGGLLIAAGAFLLTPGLVTDGIGILLVFPPTRFLFRGFLKRWILVPLIDRRTGGFVTGNVYSSGFPSEQSPPWSPQDPGQSETFDADEFNDRNDGN